MFELALYSPFRPVPREVWNRYRVRFRDENNRLIREETLVSTDQRVALHVLNRVDEVEGCEFWEYDTQQVGVSPPPQIGEYLGFPLRASGWLTVH